MSTTTLPPFTQAEVDEVVDRAKREILADIADGTVPDDVPDFSSLHDYVDANTYGGLCDGDDWVFRHLWEIPGTDGPAVIDFGNAVQAAVSQWLEAGRP